MGRMHLSTETLTGRERRISEAVIQLFAGPGYLQRNFCHDLRSLPRARARAHPLHLVLRDLGQRTGSQSMQSQPQW